MRNLQHNRRRWYSPWAMNDICSFTAFALFYLTSFAWDACLIRGGYLSLPMLQLSECVSSNYFSDIINSAMVIVLIFAACTHAIVLVWIFGYLHSSNISTDCFIGLKSTLPTAKWCHLSLCVPWVIWYMLSILLFGLCLMLFLFDFDIKNNDFNEGIYNHYRYQECGGEVLVETSNFWMFLSLILFGFLFVLQYLYCTLLRVLAGHVSLISAGNQEYNYEHNDEQSIFIRDEEEYVGGSSIDESDGPVDFEDDSKMMHT